MKKNVRFGVSNNIYNTFSNYPYTQTTALAEIIDNAIDSYEKNKNVLISRYGSDYKLIVRIDVEWDDKTDHGKTYAKEISIKDNAAGLDEEAFTRSCMTGTSPQKNYGLSEFGVGLKYAAFWFGRRWIMETSSILDNKTRILDISLDKVTQRNDDNYSYDELDSKPKDWDFNTRITLYELYTGGSALTKGNIRYVKKNIASTYRQFLRDDSVRIFVNNEPLTFDELPCLDAPYYKDLQGKSIKWKFYFTADLFKKYSVKGFIGILDRFHQGESGLVLLRRGRVIVGQTFASRYLPKLIFGSDIKSYKYNLIYGEVEVDGFEAAFGKTDIKDKDALDTLFEQMVVKAGKLKQNGFDLIQQASHWKQVNDFLSNTSEDKGDSSNNNTDGSGDSTSSTNGTSGDGNNGTSGDGNNGNGGDSNNGTGNNGTGNNGTSGEGTISSGTTGSGSTNGPDDGTSEGKIPTVIGRQEIKDSEKKDGYIVNCKFNLEGADYSIEMKADSGISKPIAIDATEFGKHKIKCLIKSDSHLLAGRNVISGEMLEVIRAIIVSYIKSTINGDHFSIDTIIDSI